MSTSTRSALPALLTVLCFAAPLFAQSVSQEPVVKTPRGSISGRVTVKDKPARGVTIGLRKSGLVSASDSFTTAVTDADGIYRIADVPAGSYLVMVSAPAFINPDVSEYKTIVVSEGENVDGMNFSLVRGGVITGKVTDAEGRPVIVQHVFIVPAESVSASRPAKPGMTVQTDDRGIYRAFGIRPGRYKVAAGQGDPATAGYFVGPSKYQRVFHPDVSDPAKATVIEVTEGSEASKVDIVLGGLAQAHSVSGRVVNGETGAPVPNLNFTLRPLVGQRLAFSRSDGRGEFVLEGVTPGKYGVMVVDDSSGLRGDKVTVEVIDRDLTDVTIKLSTGLTVSGVVILETDDKAARSKLSEVLVEGSVRPPRGSSHFGSSASGSIAADGSFTLRGLANGTLNLSLASFRNSYPPKGFSISRIERDGIATPQIELQEGQPVTGVKIFVGYGTGVVRGVVNFANGTLPSGARIFVRLTRPGENNSFGRNAPADERGRFVVEGITAGPYEISAFVNGVPNAPKPVKQQISLTDGVMTEVNLTIDLAVPERP